MVVVEVALLILVGNFLRAKISSILLFDYQKVFPTSLKIAMFLSFQESRANVIRFYGVVVVVATMCEDSVWGKFGLMPGCLVESY